MGETAGIEFAFDVDVEAVQHLSANQATHLLYIAREAISNSARQSRNTTVSLWMNAVGIRLEVRTMGWASPGRASRQGFGLRNIEARVGTERDLPGRVGSGQGTTRCRTVGRQAYATF
jgi:signal transduction histidine kinase